jgi:hypothetical protein
MSKTTPRVVLALFQSNTVANIRDHALDKTSDVLCAATGVWLTPRRSRADR